MQPHEKHEFFEFVKQQWGRERAGQLMNMLPEHQADQLASKDDVALQGSLLKTEIVEVRAELTAELRTSLAEVRGELATGLADVRGELATGLAEVRGELATGLADVRGEMHAGFAAIDRRMAEMTRTLMLAMMTLWLTSLGAMLVVVRLG